MLALTALWILSSLTPVICSHCWSVLNVPSGLNNFNIKLDPGKLFNGIITIEGVLNTDHAPESGVPDKDFLKFLAEGDPTDAPILEIETQVHKSQQCMFISGTVRDENLSWTASYPSVPNRKLICDQDGSMKISQDDQVKLQISSIDAESLEGYAVYLGGSAKLLKHHLFKYGSPENWQKFENRRIDRTRRIVNVCNHHCHVSYTKISVCSDPEPKLLDKMAVEVIRAELGKTYTLSCSASGAPYLGFEWRDKESMIIDGHEEVVPVGSDCYIQSKLVIADFDVKDAGNYTCKVFNKNFRSSVEKLVSLQHITHPTLETEIPAPPSEGAVEDTSCSCWHGYLACVLFVLILVICNLVAIYKIRLGSDNLLNTMQTGASYHSVPTDGSIRHNGNSAAGSIAVNIDATEVKLGNRAEFRNLPSSSRHLDGGLETGVSCRYCGSEPAGLPSAEEFPENVPTNHDSRSTSSKVEKRTKRGTLSSEGTQKGTKKLKFDSAPPTYGNNPKKDN